MNVWSTHSITQINMCKASLPVTSDQSLCIYIPTKACNIHWKCYPKFNSLAATTYCLVAPIALMKNFDVGVLENLFLLQNTHISSLMYSLLFLKIQIDPLEVVGLLYQMFWVSRVETISSWRVMINYIWGSQRFDYIPFFVVNHLSHGSILALEDVNISFFLSIDEETS